MGVWFTDQNSQPIEASDRINLTLVINWYSYYKNASSIAKIFLKANKYTTDAIKTSDLSDRSN